MTLEQIQDMWDKDCCIDTTNLTNEAQNIPKLHAKYYRIFIKQRMIVAEYQRQLKKLRFEKYEFFINPTEYHVKQLKWTVPAQGKLLKTEVNQYVDSDKDVIDLELKIALQQEKTQFCKSIIDTVNTRGFLLKTILDERKFNNGL